jgi:hypothetical protein
MFLPRFTLRWLLGLMTAAAGVSLVLSFAVRGRPWALGVTAGLWSLVLVFLFYVAAFLAAWVISRLLLLRGGSARADSPFVEAAVAARGDTRHDAALLRDTAAATAAQHQPPVENPPITG